MLSTFYDPSPVVRSYPGTLSPCTPGSYVTPHLTLARDAQTNTQFTAIHDVRSHTCKHSSLLYMTSGHTHANTQFTAIHDVRSHTCKHTVHCYMRSFTHM